MMSKKYNVGIEIEKDLFVCFECETLEDFRILTETWLEYSIEKTMTIVLEEDDTER